MQSVKKHLLASVAALPLIFGATVVDTAEWVTTTVVSPVMAATSPSAAALHKAVRAARSPAETVNPCAAETPPDDPRWAEQDASSPCAAENPWAAEKAACAPDAVCSPCEAQAADNPCATDNPCAAEKTACAPCNPGTVANPCAATVPAVDSTMPVDEILAGLKAPPVHPVGEILSLQEVARDIELDALFQARELKSLGFDFDSAEVKDAEAGHLGTVAAVIEKVLSERPHEVFFIEGHADAVGPDEYNLWLSKRRAQRVKQALLDIFGIPERNLMAGGFGETYLRVNTPQAEPRNRRVTVRRVTPLVKTAAAADRTNAPVRKAKHRRRPQEPGTVRTSYARTVMPSASDIR